MDADTLTYVCAWCDVVYGAIPVPPGNGGVSHGICEDCLEIHYPEDAAA